MLTYILAGIILLYFIGHRVDKRAGKHWFIGGLLPFIGWRTAFHGPMQFKGFYTAWLWFAVCWKGTLSPRK